MSSPDRLSIFDTAVVAFEIRFEQKLDSSWGHLEYETRMAIVGEGLEIDAHPWEKRDLLLQFFDHAGDAIASVINEYFSTLLEVATAQREHLGDETPLIWTRAKILTQVCDFLGMDEKLDETSAPRDDSRALKTAEQITAGLGWRDDEAPSEFCLPWWANMSSLFSLRRLRVLTGSWPTRNDTVPLSRADTLEWVKWKEWLIHEKLERQIDDNSLDGMIKAGNNGAPAGDLAMVAKKRFFRSGDTWTVSIVDGESGQFSHLLGWDYLWAYVRHAGQELGVSQVQALCNEPPPPGTAATVRDFITELSRTDESDASSLDASGATGQALTDHQAIKQCKDRAREIEGEISRANNLGQQTEVSRLTEELRSIDEYLQRSTERVICRRPRQFSNESERARQRIGQAINRVFTKLKSGRYPQTLAYFSGRLTLGKTGCFRDDTSGWQLDKPTADRN